MREGRNGRRSRKFYVEFVLVETLQELLEGRGSTQSSKRHGGYRKISRRLISFTIIEKCITRESDLTPTSFRLWKWRCTDIGVEERVPDWVITLIFERLPDSVGFLVPPDASPPSPTQRTPPRRVVHLSLDQRTYPILSLLSENKVFKRPLPKTKYRQTEVDLRSFSVTFHSFVWKDKKGEFDVGRLPTFRTCTQS